MLELEARLANDPSPVPFGLLAGSLCVCPQTKLEYLLIDEITASRDALTAADPAGELADALRSLASSTVRHGKLALGWYIGGLGEVLQLDLELASVHREVFPDAWQVALLRDARAGAAAGALVRLEPLTNRSYQIPFFELLPDAAGRSGSEAPHTAIRWTTYTATEPVLQLSASNGFEAKPSEAAATRADGGRAIRWLSFFRAQHAAEPEPPGSSAGRNRRTPVDVPDRPTDTPHVDVPLARSQPLDESPAVDAYPADHSPQPLQASLTTPKTPVDHPVSAPALVDRPAGSSAVEGAAHAQPMQQLFIDGSLVTFPAEAPEYADESSSTSGSGRQWLVAAVCIALVLIALIAVYVVTR